MERVANAALAQFDPLQGLLRTGIDEVAYRKGHHYLTVVLDHDCGRLLCASSGRNEETLHCCFDALGPVRCKQLQLVRADAASYIANVVKECRLSAVPCLGPCHIAKWATEALDVVRREVWNQLRRDGKKAQAQSLKRSPNNKLRLLTSLAFGFHSPDHLISLALLKLGGLCPPPPGRR